MACADEVEKILEARPGRIAALVIEPLMQGADGMIAQPRGYLRRMREACDRHGALLVTDEVATGWGRTGTTFAVEQERVRPDILTMAKGLTGGYLPLAATVTTEAVFESFLGTYEERRTFFHGHTYAGNPLACAAATASMKLFRERKILERLPDQIARFARALAPAVKLPHVGDVRQRGLMVGIELVKDRGTREEYAYGLRVGHQVILEARKLGAILRPLGNVVVLMPPLAMTGEELEQLAAITLESIARVTARLG
jgi:adenosylmethionine-8-amino-7-oxononanoate aminotransferase